MDQDIPRAVEAKRRMLAANPDTGMEVPQSPKSIEAARELLRAVFGPKEAPSNLPIPEGLPQSALAAFTTHPGLVSRVNWSEDKIPEQGVRAFFQPPGMFETKGRVNVSPEFKNQIDNVWHELSHVLGLEDFGGGVTAHDVTEASRRANRPRDVNLPSELKSLSRAAAMQQALARVK